MTSETLELQVSSYEKPLNLSWCHAALVLRWCVMSSLLWCCVTDPGEAHAFPGGGGCGRRTAAVRPVRTETSRHRQLAQLQKRSVLVLSGTVQETI